jgi:hypothetical protein
MIINLNYIDMVNFSIVALRILYEKQTSITKVLKEEMIFKKKKQLKVWRILSLLRDMPRKNGLQSTY